MEIKKVDLEDYKEKLITEQGWICPISQRYFDTADGVILYVNDHDYLISPEGMDTLRTKYGEAYVNDKVVHSMEIKEDLSVTRDKG